MDTQLTRSSLPQEPFHSGAKSPSRRRSVPRPRPTPSRPPRAIPFLRAPCELPEVDAVPTPLVGAAEPPSAAVVALRVASRSPPQSTELGPRIPSLSRSLPKTSPNGTPHQPKSRSPPGASPPRQSPPLPPRQLLRAPHPLHPRSPQLPKAQRPPGRACCGSRPSRSRPRSRRRPRSRPPNLPLNLCPLPSRPNPSPKSRPRSRSPPRSPRRRRLLLPRSSPLPLLSR